MTRSEARAIVGRNQPRWALSNMARALQLMTSLNNQGDWKRLEALRALGYKVTVTIPSAQEQEARARRVDMFRARLARSA